MDPGDTKTHGSGAGSVQINYRSGSGSRRPKHIRIRILNTDWNKKQDSGWSASRAYENQGFLMEGSGSAITDPDADLGDPKTYSGPVQINYGSGCGSRRHKNIRVQSRIRTKKITEADPGDPKTYGSGSRIGTKMCH